MVEFYTQKNIFFLPEESRWSHIINNSKQDNIALIIDTALHLNGQVSFNYYMIKFSIFTVKRVT